MVVMLGDGSDSSGRFGALLDERRSLYSAVFANNPPSKWLKVDDRASRACITPGSVVEAVLSNDSWQSRQRGSARTRPEFAGAHHRVHLRQQALLRPSVDGALQLPAVLVIVPRRVF